MAKTLSDRMRDLHERLELAGQYGDAGVLEDAVWAIETLETDVAWAAAKRAALSVKREPDLLGPFRAAAEAFRDTPHEDSERITVAQRYGSPGTSRFWFMSVGDFRALLSASPPEASQEDDPGIAPVGELEMERWDASVDQIHRELAGEVPPPSDLQEARAALEMQRCLCRGGFVCSRCKGLAALKRAGVEVPEVTGLDVDGLIPQPSEGANASPPLTPSCGPGGAPEDVEALDTRVAYAIAMCLSPESEYGGKFWRCAACGAIIDNTDESEEHAENCPVTVLTALRSRPVEPEPVAWRWRSSWDDSEPGWHYHEDAKPPRLIGDYERQALYASPVAPAWQPISARKC